MSASPITPEHAIYGIPTLAGATISPDGARIAWVRTQVNQATNTSESQIWLANADGSDARQLTQVGTGNAQPTWSPDSTAIAYVSKRDGDHPFAIALLTFDGGESLILTSHDKSPSNLAWSPDGSTIAYVKPVDPENPNETPRDPKAPPAVRVVTRIDYKQDGIGFVNDVRTQLFTVDVASGERTQRTSELVDHVQPHWSPDGAKLAIILPVLNGMRSQLGIIDVSTNELTAFGDERGEFGLPAWSPNGTTILYTADLDGGPHKDIYTLDVASGESTLILSDPPYLAEAGAASTSTPVWIDDTTVVIHGVSRGRSGLWTIDTAAKTTTELASWDAVHAGLSIDVAHTTAVQTALSVDGTIAVVATDLSNGTRMIVADEGTAAFAEHPVAQVEVIEIERNGFTIQGWLLKPADFDPSKTYPVILDIHGGPHGFYSFTYNNHAETLATNGFLVLLSNPRGSSTYGRDFANAVHDDWGGEDWKDLQAILDTVLERPYADADRTGIYGYSYGGYMTSWAIGHTDRFKAAIVGAPDFDQESFFGTSDIGHHFGPAQIGSTPWADREKVAAQSPSSFIQNATTPTLVVHGEADERCPIGQGEQLFISLKKLGVETTFARYPGGFHGFINSGYPTHRLDFYQRSLAWFKQYLGDPA